MRASTVVMVGFAVLFGLLAVFLAQVWLNNQADQRLKSLEAQRKAEPPARTIVVAAKSLRFGDELSAAAMREVRMAHCPHNPALHLATCAAPARHWPGEMLPRPPPVEFTVAGLP